MRLKRSMKTGFVAISLFLFLRGCMAWAVDDDSIRKVEAPPEKLQPNP